VKNFEVGRRRGGFLVAEPGLRCYERDVELVLLRSRGQRTRNGGFRWTPKCPRCGRTIRITLAEVMRGTARCVCKARLKADPSLGQAIRTINQGLNRIKGVTIKFK
jgi:hypothetical protein